MKRYWVLVAAAALLAAAFTVSSTAWAAPPASVKYQTVPRPTPTPEDNPVATATPRPDDDDDDDDDDEGDVSPPGDSGGSTSDREVPVFLIAPEEPEQPAEALPDLTASITVATLNVREGPGTEFSVIGRLSSGDVVNVLARNDSNDWWYICCVPGTSDEGWTSAQLLAPDFDRAMSADTIPLFGAEPEPVAVAAAVESEPEPVASTAEIPLVLNMSLSPRFVRQGQTAELLLEVSNPNLEEAINVELSDQLPQELELVETVASDQGRVSQQETDEGTPLVLVRWESIPAGESVQATLTVKVVEDLEDGTVFDNLAAVRGANATYASAAVTIGMPPVLLPDFQ